MSNSIPDILSITYLKVFPFAGWDPTNGEWSDPASNEETENNKNLELYARMISWLMRLTSLLGLPNQMPMGTLKAYLMSTSTDNNKQLDLDQKEANKIILKHIWKNILDWDDEGDFTLNIIWASLRCAFFFMRAIYSTVRSPVKMVTELLSSFIANLFKEAAHRSWADMDKASKEQKKGDASFQNSFDIVINAVSWGTAKVFYFLLETVHFIGKAITSPAKGLKAAWHSAHKEEYGGEGIAGDVLGAFLFASSFALSVAGCILLSLLTSDLLTNVEFLVDIAKWMDLSAIGSLLNPIYDTLGMVLTPEIIDMHGLFAFIGAGVGFLLPAVGLINNALPIIARDVLKALEELPTLAREMFKSFKHGLRNLLCCVSDNEEIEIKPRDSLEKNRNAEKPFAKDDKKTGTRVEWKSQNYSSKNLKHFVPEPTTTTTTTQTNHPDKIKLTI